MIARFVSKRPRYAFKAAMRFGNCPHYFFNTIDLVQLVHYYLIQSAEDHKTVALCSLGMEKLVKYP